MMMQSRNASLDAFRCLLMFLIVLNHNWVFGVFHDAEGARLLELLLGVLLMWHVDGFIGLSGWFGVNFSWRKFFRLWGVIAFYSALGTVWRLAVLDLPWTQALKVDGGWFAAGYLSLMLLSPILNPAIELLARKSRYEILSAWALFTIVIMGTILPYHGFTAVYAPGANSWSLLTFVYVYFTFRVVRLLDLVKFYNIRHFFVILCVFVVGGGGVGSMLNGWIELSAYLAPQVLAMSIGCFLLFQKYIRVSDWLARIVLYLAPSMFGVYLCHIAFKLPSGFMLYVWPQMRMQEKGHSPLVSVLVSSLICFVTCVVFDLLRRGGLCLIRKVVGK